MTFNDNIINIIKIDDEISINNSNLPNIQTNNKRFLIETSVPDPNKPDFLLYFSELVIAPSDMLISILISKFCENKPQLSNYNFYLSNKNILYEDGTISSCGIENNSKVELISLENDNLISKNEGFGFTYWSILPLIISISFLLSGLIGRFDMITRAVYFMIGTLIGTPSLVILILGLIEYYSSFMKVAFIGKYWFSSSFEFCNLTSCFCSCSKEEIKIEDDFEEYIKV